MHVKSSTFVVIMSALFLYNCSKDSYNSERNGEDIRITALPSKSPHTKADNSNHNSIYSISETGISSDLLGTLNVYSGDVSTFCGSNSAGNSATISSGTYYSRDRIDKDNDGLFDTERIDWVQGDGVSIIDWRLGMEEKADYLINSVHSGTSASDAHSSFATLAPVSNSLKWREVEHDDEYHHFFGLYPQQKSGMNIQLEDGLTDFYITAGYTVEGLSMPNVQYCTLKNGNLYIPDMQYAPMFAGTYIKQRDGKNNGLNLRFYPNFTAYEFQLYNPDSSKDIRINSATLSSSTSNLASSSYSVTTITVYGSNNFFTYNSNTAPSASVSKSINVFFRNSESGPNTSVPLSADIANPTIFTLLAMSTINEGEAATHTNLTIHLNMTVDGENVSKKLNLSTTSGWISVPSNKKIIISNLGVKTPDKVYPFSISPTEQIEFAPGNLQAKLNGSGAASQWRFAEHQFDFIGTTGSNTSISSGTGWMDLFGWSGTNSMNYGIKQTDGTINMGTIGIDFGGNFEDWGNNTLLKSNLGSGWSTLSKDEWNYLLTTRSGAAQKKGFAYIDGVKGLVLLPNTWVLPDGCSFTAGGSATAPTNRYNTAGTSTGSGSWLKMEKAGAVFLPFAGYSNLYNSVSTNHNHYWTSTPNAWNWPMLAYYMDADTGTIYEGTSVDAASGGFLCTGFAIRLVRRL